jgi:hypothetical protein
MVDIVVRTNDEELIISQRNTIESLRDCLLEKELIINDLRKKIREFDISGC